jgi:hypothetical protein
MSAVVEHDHLSGCTFRAPGLLGQTIVRSTARVGLITVTEADRAVRGDELEHDGWTLTRGVDGVRGESAILSDDAVWRRLEHEVVQLGGDLDGIRGEWWAPVALFEHLQTGLTLLVTPTHTPASVEASWAHGLRARQHRAGVEAWQRVVSDWSEQHQPDAALAVADWNLNLHRDWVRDWVREEWPGMTPIPVKTVPAGGSLGRRLVDWPISTGIADRSLTVLPKHPASDHRGIRMTGTIRA